MPYLSTDDFAAEVVRVFIIDELQIISNMLFKAQSIMASVKTTPTLEVQCLSPKTKLVNASIITKAPATEKQFASVKAEATTTDTSSQFEPKSVFLECFNQIELLEKNVCKIKLFKEIII